MKLVLPVILAQLLLIFICFTVIIPSVVDWLCYKCFTDNSELGSTTIEGFMTFHHKEALSGRQLIGTIGQGSQCNQSSAKLNYSGPESHPKRTQGLFQLPASVGRSGHSEGHTSPTHKRLLQIRQDRAYGTTTFCVSWDTPQPHQVLRPRRVPA